MRHAWRGFTLIELLVALAIFAVVSVLSLRAVSAALDHRAYLEDEGRKWRDLGRVFATIESDLAAALAEPGALFGGYPAPTAEDGTWIELARAGRSDDAETPVAPRGVRYRLVGGHIERASFHDLSARSGEAAVGVSRYPSQVRSLSLRYLQPGGNWIGEWPHRSADMPRAIEISVELVTNERIRRVMLVR